jgi:hypothetical protein
VDEALGIAPSKPSNKPWQPSEGEPWPWGAGEEEETTGNRDESEGDYDDEDPLITWLQEIVSHSTWDVEDLLAWATEFLADYYHDDDEQRHIQRMEDHQRELQHIAALKPQVCPYHHDPALPPLPKSPDGQLFGVGFIYDGDCDDRVLLAIDKLKGNPAIVALAEHEGKLRIYARLPTGLTGINVYSDEWVVTEFVPYQGCWIELDDRFMRQCATEVLKKEA